MQPQQKQAVRPEELAATPACAEACALRAAAARANRIGDEDTGHQAIAALLEHQRGCAVCNPGDVPWGSRVLGRMGQLIERLLCLLLGPSRTSGEYRRFSLFMAPLISAAVAFGVGVNSLLAALDGQLDTAGLRERGLILAAAIPSYFVGCWLAGAAWDATRGIRHRFAGYLLRGGATSVALYGTVGLVIPLVFDEYGYDYYPLILVGSAGLGALVGAGKWIKDLLTGNLPTPVRLPDERSADAR